MESFLNKAVGLLARIGIGPRYIHLLEVQGRRTGKTYSTPVNLLELNGRHYLVGGRGHSGWSKNARANGIVTLRRGRLSKRFRAVPIPDDKKPEIIKAYLDEYPRTVQRFFAVPAGSPVDAFAAIADKHPVFELVRF
jgi:deazaflavin-dependent oxidoreductase (nitroreductase family)